VKVLLVHPQNPDTFWSFRHVLRLIGKRSAFPPLGLLTIAAMLPGEWELELVDANVRSLRDEDVQWADYVFISGMIVHKDSVRDIAARCRRLGKPVVAGGPLFTTCHADFPEIDHFVIGEAEDVMPALVDDMIHGAVRRHYQAKRRPDISRLPTPLWRLIDPRHYVTMSVQFSRGCPYDCEFCDIVVMNGRVPRTKSPQRLISELEALRVRGWKDMVFIVDDNFIGDRRRVKALLREMLAWRERTRPAMRFFTEASINLADDPELCDLMRLAGFTKVFVGIETPVAESLTECHKVQNENRDLVRSVRTIQRAGFEVMGGFIVGFDSDTHDVFRRQFDFIQRSGVVSAMVGLLTALPETRLHRRLVREGRLESASSGNNTEAGLNFIPKLGRDFLLGGYRELMRRLYEPRAFYQRIRTFLEHHRPPNTLSRLSAADFRGFLKSLWLLGGWHRGRWAYWRFFCSTLLRRPRQFSHAMELAIMGHHFRRLSASL
jgi:radical SAM superfamily enzyme YgiQ (UPF0313 family)